MEALTLRDIKEKLHSLFGEDNRLVFWYDGEGDFEDTVDTLVPDDVTVLRLTGRNAFRAKLRLEHEDPEGRYLIYAPFTKPDVRQNVLEDTLLYSKEFYADQLSYFMADAHIPSRLRPAMERLKPFFFGPGGRSSAKVRAEAARRREDFLERSREFDWYTAEEKTLCRVAICTLVQARNTTVDDLFYGLFADSDSAMMAHWQQIQDFGLATSFWDLCKERFGYEAPKPDLDSLILALFAVTTFRDDLDKLPKPWQLYAQDSVQSRVNNCNVLLDNMMNHVLYQDRYDALSAKAASQLDAKNVLTKLPLELFLHTSSFACIDELFIQWVNDRLVGLDPNGEVGGLSLEALCDLRLKLHFGQHFRSEYSLLLAAQKLLARQDYEPRTTLKELTETYCQSDYQIDTEYRHFFTAYDALDGENPGQFDTLRALVQNFYQNAFLEPLLLQWNEAYGSDYLQEIVPRQRYFYQDEVRPVKEKVAVLISDAFRLEAAKELAARFRDDENCSVEEKVRIAPLPSITLLGMAELLPHDTLELTRDDTPKVLLDGKPCATTTQREKLLQQENPRSAAIRYDDLVAMKASELKSFSAGKEVIYVYHNRIDATGEASKTENSVFQAADQTIDELFRLVKRLSKSGNIYRFLITADHGFLYTRKALDPTDKLDTVEAGKTWMTDRRFLLMDQPVDREGIYSIPLGKSLGNEDTRSIVLAKGMSVFKCHGGMNYVHGGSSPQELLVPCLFISTRKGLVDTEDVGLALINDIRKITAFHVKFSFYQEQAISDVVKPVTYRIRFETGSGEIISNEVLYRAESKAAAPGDRIVVLSFDLQKKNYDLNDRYYLKVINEKTGQETLAREVVMDLPDVEL